MNIVKIERRNQAIDNLQKAMYELLAIDRDEITLSVVQTYEKELELYNERGKHRESQRDVAIMWAKWFLEQVDK